MKIYTLLFCTALTAIWAMPVSALTFDEEINVIISGGGLQEVRAESLWIATDPEDFVLFEADQWSKRIELENAFFPSSSGNLVITPYDAGGAPLTKGSSFAFSLGQPDPNVLEYVIVISAIDQGAANLFVHGLGSNVKSIGITPIIPVECILDNEDVVIEAHHIYSGIIEASDDLVIPGFFACP